MNRKTFLLIIFFLFSLIYAEKTLVILHTNDIHGHILPSKDIDTFDQPKDIGGLDYLASYVKQIRMECKKKNEPFLLLDAGDFFHGTPEGYKGNSIITIMNAIGYDALSIGNHEFAFGENNLIELSLQATFPFLCANIRKNKEIPSYVKPYIIKTFNDLKIGIIGAITEKTPFMNFPESVKNIIFLSPAPEINKYVSLLKQEKVDFIILLSHLGNLMDEQIANFVPNINVIIGGHNHIIIDPIKPIGPFNTLICQVGEYGQRIGHLKIKIYKNRILNYEYKVVNLYNELFKQDNQIKNLVEKYKVKEMDKIIGFATKNIIHQKSGESTLGNFIADIMREKTKKDIAFISSGGIRANLLKGKITLRDVYAICPFNDTLVTLKINGEELLKILEKNISQRRFFLQFSGLTLKYNPEHSKRIKEVKVANKKIELTKEYTVVTTSYLAYGNAEEFMELKKSRYKIDTKIFLYKAIAEYIKTHSSISGPKNRRVTKILMMNLSTKFSGIKININTANIETLKTLPCIKNKRALAIIEYREKYGPFKSTAEIIKVKCIGPKIYQKIKDKIKI